MPIIELKQASCKQCGSGKRTINIKSFRKDFMLVTEQTLRIWRDKKKCWACKAKPKVNEKWGISINHGEKNRVYCPMCSTNIESLLERKESMNACTSHNTRYKLTCGNAIALLISERCTQLIDLEGKNDFRN